MVNDTNYSYIMINKFDRTIIFYLKPVNCAPRAHIASLKTDKKKKKRFTPNIFDGMQEQSITKSNENNVRAQHRVTNFRPCYSAELCNLRLIGIRYVVNKMT